MFQTDETKQASLFAFSHRDLVSDDSDAWLYIDVFEVLDLQEFDEWNRGTPDFHGGADTGSHQDVTDTKSSLTPFLDRQEG